MTRAEAQRRIDLLSAVTVERGASVNEARVASQKAARLRERFKVSASAPPPPRARRVFRAAASAARAQTVEQPWFEDMVAGKASAGVTVKRFRDRSNWSIETDRVPWAR